MNHSTPRRSRVPQRGVALCSSVLGFVIIVSLAFSACSQASPETPAESAKAAPSDSGQTEARRQIEAATIEIWRAVERGDSSAILAHYADDALIFGSGAPMVQGKPAVAAFLQGLFGGNTLRDVKGNITDIMVSDDLAVETGTYAMTIIPKNGSPVGDKGKYIHVWRKSAGGSWKVVRYAPTSDIPPR
jgi:ketosteroid isomerase-like protein